MCSTAVIEEADEIRRYLDNSFRKCGDVDEEKDRTTIPSIAELVQSTDCSAAMAIYSKMVMMICSERAAIVNQLMLVGLLCTFIAIQEAQVPGS